jgi:carbon-monoxide dehydrogenase large subunit
MSVHAYRGAGRPEATALLERIMDMLGVELDMDPAELRRRNFYRPDEFPVTTPVDAVYDTGDYEAALDAALDLAGYDDLREEQERRRARGDRVQLGIGLSSYVEVTAADDEGEWAAADFDDAGTLTLRVGTAATGQGHETAFAQIAAEQFRIPLSDIEVVFGDTDRIARGAGTGGSRSLQIGGTALYQAGEAVVAKARTIVAHLLEASPADVVVMDGGRMGIAGVPDTALTWAQLASLARDPSRIPDGMDPGLGAETLFDQGAASYPFGTHVSVVDVDVETGDVTVVRHVAVDDAGEILNRLLLDGQVHGGIAQGIGQARYEEMRYDENGTPLTGNLVTYLLPFAPNLPAFEVAHTVTPTHLNPLGVKGIGEAATIGSTVAVQNAVIDAVRPFGVHHIDMPLTADRVWHAIHDARS